MIMFLKIDLCISCFVNENLLDLCFLIKEDLVFKIELFVLYSFVIIDICSNGVIVKRFLIFF